MTQDERWQKRYEELVDFIKVNRRNPSNPRIEEHDMLNWLKANRKKMNYSEHQKAARMAALAQGVTPEQFDRQETWYYDETDNVKHLVLLQSRKVNADSDRCFVLGGIQAEDIITDEELHSSLGKTPGKELKANKDLRGNFEVILRKENLKKVLELIETKGWNIHFMMVQVWYYAFVDIIDSINNNIGLSFSLKAILYKILKTFPDDTVNHLGKYHYPNIADRDKVAFLTGLVELTWVFLKAHPNANDTIMALILVRLLNNAKAKTKLTFIQDESPDEWVTWFKQFYAFEIASYPQKTLVLDTEKQVEKSISEKPIEIDGVAMTNYRFEDSSNPMIQVCDYVVSILRKYAVFLDRSFAEVIADINKFEVAQLDNFKLLNKILKRSLDNNPLYFHYITSVELQYNINQLMERYGI